jgi:hypothetical protein
MPLTIFVVLARFATKDQNTQPSDKKKGPFRGISCFAQATFGEKNLKKNRKN